jgi:hypothetical protein
MVDPGYERMMGDGNAHHFVCPEPEITDILIICI